MSESPLSAVKAEDLNELPTASDEDMLNDSTSKRAAQRSMCRSQ